MVHPKLNANANSNVFQSKDGLLIDSQKIKPLILDKVIVKAKKTKEKEDADAKVPSE